jgi:hypothetical protein
MGIESQQKQSNDRRIISQGIQWWMSQRGFSLRELAYLTKRSENYIKKVIACEPVEIRLDFLQSCITAFNRRSNRIKSFEETDDILSWDECVDLLKPPLPTPPRQANFLDYL